jgi:ABC-type branched-subunit amino acid transport system substrate-binding protein
VLDRAIAREHAVQVLWPRCRHWRGRPRRRSTITGASDTEIRSATSCPYSGPASAYGTIGKRIGAYFNKVNAEGGINGRKINLHHL